MGSLLPSGEPKITEGTRQPDKDFQLWDICIIETAIKLWLLMSSVLHFYIFGNFCLCFWAWKYPQSYQCHFSELVSGVIPQESTLHRNHFTRKWSCFLNVTASAYRSYLIMTSHKKDGEKSNQKWRLTINKKMSLPILGFLRWILYFDPCLGTYVSSKYSSACAELLSGLTLLIRIRLCVWVKLCVNTGLCRLRVFHNPIPTVLHKDPSIPVAFAYR